MNPVNRVSIKGLKKAKILQAIYPVAPCIHPRSWPSPSSLSVEESELILEGLGPQLYLYNLYGKIINIDLSGDTVYPSFFDRGLRPGMFRDIINDLRHTGQNPESDFIRRQISVTRTCEFNRQD